MARPPLVGGKVDTVEPGNEVFASFLLPWLRRARRIRHGLHAPLHAFDGRSLRIGYGQQDLPRIGVLAGPPLIGAIAMRPLVIW